MFDFCDNDHRSSRCALRIPFVENGYLYATDGFIAVRVPTDAKDTEIPGIKFPKAGPIFSTVDPTDPAPVPLPFVSKKQVMIGDAWISANYWNKISRLPGVSLACKINPEKPIAFVFDYKARGDGQLIVTPFYF
jgi:hypothetical protein